LSNAALKCSLCSGYVRTLLGEDSYAKPRAFNLSHMSLSTTMRL